MRLLAEEAAAHLPTSPHVVTTPTNVTYNGELSILDTNPHDVCAVSIVRAGDSLLESVREIAPAVRVGRIQRNETSSSKEAVHSCTKLPKGIKDMHILLCDPMLATGGSACAALSTLIKEGVDEKNIVFANVISCPEGLTCLAEQYPNIKIVTCWIDDGLNEYGDRFFNTVDFTPDNHRSAVLTESMMAPMLNSVYEVIAHGFSQSIKQIDEQLAALNEQQHQHLMAYQARTEERLLQQDDRMDKIWSCVERLDLKATNLEQRLIDVEKHQANLGDNAE